MRPFEKKLLRFSGYALILLVVAAIFFPVYACGCGRLAAPRSACLSKLKSQGLALVQYSEDNNDRFPQRDYWMDAIYPYTKDASILHDVKLADPFYGYAFNGTLSGAKTADDDAARPMTYDSVNLIRNASDPVTSLPEWGRHSGVNNIGYADGHAKSKRMGQPK